MIRIAVLGYGTVGSGVVKVIQTNAKIIAKRAGQEVEVKYVLIGKAEFTLLYAEVITASISDSDRESLVSI